jgi:dephospho-CoA kinase
MKIGICGRMCSGKSTLANNIIEYNKKKNINIVKDSFAAKIYDIAYDIFGMTTKDRQLLQQIGTKFRDIDDKVWINYIINKHPDNVIIDDVRYQNEITTLKENGFILIKLSISRELQLTRLRELYKDDFDRHYKNIDHISELFVDVAPDNMFDIVVDVDTEDSFNKIKHLV